MALSEVEAAPCVFDFFLIVGHPRGPKSPPSILYEYRAKNDESLPTLTPDIPLYCYPRRLEIPEVKKKDQSLRAYHIRHPAYSFATTVVIQEEDRDGKTQSILYYMVIVRDASFTVAVGAARILLTIRKLCPLFRREINHQQIRPKTTIPLHFFLASPFSHCSSHLCTKYLVPCQVTIFCHSRKESRKRFKLKGAAKYLSNRFSKISSH